MVTREPTRQLRDALEPVIGSVYFSPECHARYEALGFDGSSGERQGVAMPDGPAYFCSRGSILGQVTGEVIAAAFAVFNPEAVNLVVPIGWAKTDAATIFAERQTGAVEQLERILGTPPELATIADRLEDAARSVSVTARPLAAGLRGAPAPGGDWARLFRAGDFLREFRGDSHNIAWVGAGLDAVEIGILSELSWGLPAKTYSRSRAWSTEQLDAAIDRLTARGLLADERFTDAGRAFRDEIEAATDRQCAPLVDALGDSFDETIGVLSGWAAAVVAAKGYPVGPSTVAGTDRAE